MKNIALSLTILLSLTFVGGVVFAQDPPVGGELPAVSQVELPDPGLTPDSPLYFLEIIAEKVGTFFTFGDVKKAERHALLAAERMAEAKVMVEQESFDKAQGKKTKLLEKTLKRYEDQLVKALFRAERAETKGKDTEEVAKIITEATQKHLIVLEEVLEKVPEEAKPAIEHAMEVSTPKGLEEAVEEFKIQKVSSGESFDLLIAKCLEQGAPPEFCESLKQALQSSYSPREICTKSGGPAEMCEKIPLRGFKSFEEIKNLCLESGGPTEACSLLEAKCKEFGITSPDACFRALSVSSVTTYQKAELKAVPAPVRTEGEMSEAEMKERARIEMEIEEASRIKAESTETKIKYEIDGKIIEKVLPEGVREQIEGLKIGQ